MTLHLRNNSKAGEDHWQIYYDRYLRRTWIKKEQHEPKPDLLLHGSHKKLQKDTDYQKDSMIFQC